MVGSDSGEISIFDKTNLNKLNQHQIIKSPVLKLAQAMQAVICQYKDLKGTLHIYQQPSSKNNYDLQIVTQIDTQVQSFTTFSSALISGQMREQILIVTPVYNRAHIPKLWLLNENADGLATEVEIENRTISDSADKTKKPFVSQIKQQQDESKVKKEEVKNKSSKSTIDKKSVKKDVKFPSKTKEENKKSEKQEKMGELPPNGVLTCLQLTNSVETSSIFLFIGYESGAIGCHKLSFDQENNRLTSKQVVSTQKMIQDPNTQHVLSIQQIFLKPTQEYFKVVIGYYSSILQTLDFTLASDDETYMLSSQNLTDNQTFVEKPGIGCIDTLIIGSKALGVIGSFDHRIRVISVKTLKKLLLLNFHQGIVNKVHVELNTNTTDVDQEDSKIMNRRQQQNESMGSGSSISRERKSDLINVYSVSEDSYLAKWTLEI
eukprot:403349860